MFFSPISWPKFQSSSKISGIGVLTADRRCPIKTKVIFSCGHIKTTVIYHIKMKITVGTYPAFLLPVCCWDGGTGFVNSAEASPRRTEGLLFTNPGSAAKISLAEERRSPDENYSFTGPPFQPTVRCLIRSQCLVWIVSNSGQPEHAVGVNKQYITLNCKKSRASYAVD